MIMAAINPKTKEFLGLIIPKADLETSITIRGSAKDWEAAVDGKRVDPDRIEVIKHIPTSPSGMTAYVDRQDVRTIVDLKVEVEDL